MSISKVIRERVWRKDYGNNLDAICQICNQNRISAFNFELGHIISRKHKGTDTEDNLKAICNICNKSMGTKNLHDFVKSINKTTDKTHIREPVMEQYREPIREQIREPIREYNNYHNKPIIYM